MPVEYSSVVWDPHTKTNMETLEKVQRRAARFVCADYRRRSSVDAMIHRLKWPLLAERRAMAKATMFYRIVKGLVDIPPQPYLSASLRSEYKYILPYARINSFQKSFFVDGVRLWNSLGENLWTAGSLDIFKHRVHSAVVTQ